MAAIGILLVPEASSALPGDATGASWGTSVPLLALDDGRVYVADPLSFQIDRRLPDGAHDSSWSPMSIPPTGRLPVAADGDRLLIAGLNAGPSTTTYVERLAADGSPDHTFGDAGRVVIPGSSAGSGLAVDAQHRVLVSVEHQVIRLRPDGSVDGSFAAGAAPVDGVAGPIAVRADGSVLVASTNLNTGTITVQQLRDDGSLDASWASSGTVTLTPPPYPDPYAAQHLVELGGGDVVVAGQWWAARLTPTGDVSATRWGLTGCTDHFEGFDVDGDGNVYLGGYANTALPSSRHGLVVRLDSKLQLDPTFGAGGISFTGTTSAYQMVVQRLQRQLLVGRSNEFGRAVNAEPALAMAIGTGPPQPAISGTAYDLITADQNIVTNLYGPPRYVATTTAGLCHSWATTANGQVSSLGGQATFGDLNGHPSPLPVVGIAATPSGQGYWLTAADGAVYSFGDAPFAGSANALRLQKPIVGIATTPSGHGYWLTSADGGVFSFGDAHFYGSMAGVRLNKPVVAIASTPSGRGYWLAAADGGVFTFGDAPFFGSAARLPLTGPVMTIVATPSGNGYWLASRDGGVFTFGSAPFLGSAAGSRSIYVGLLVR